MSVVVRIGEPDAPRSRRRRERWLIAAGTCVGLLLLAALPFPRFREARALRGQCANLEERVERARADADAARAWETGDRERAPAVHAEYRRWFATGERQLATREHVLQSARTLDLQITDVAVTDAADDRSAASAFALPAGSELVRITGQGRTDEIARLGALLPKLDPPLRLVSWEFSGRGVERSFTIVAERFHERSRSGGE